MKYFLLLFTLIFFWNFSYAQNPTIDSLKNSLQSKSEDTSKVKILNALGIELWKCKNDTSAKKYAEEAIALSKKLNFNNGMATAYMTIGNLNQSEGNPKEAQNYFGFALSLFDAVIDKQQIAQCYIAMGTACYYDQSISNAEALKNFYSALKLLEELNDTSRISDCHRLIAMIYAVNGADSTALENLETVLKTYEELNDSGKIAYTCNIIGEIFFKKGKNSEALAKFSRALEIYEALGSTIPGWGKAWTYSYLGRINRAEAELAYTSGDKIKAIEKYNEALTIFQLRLKLELEGAMKSTDSYFDLADLIIRKIQLNLINLKSAQGEEAKKYLDTGLKNSLAYNEIGLISQIYLDFSIIDSIEGNYEKALNHFKLHKLYEASISNEENAKRTTRILLQNDFDKKEAAAKAEQHIKDMRDRNIRNSILAGLGGMFVFSLVVIRQRNKIKSGKKRSDELLLNILPEEVAEELKLKGSSKAKQFDEVTVMFTDFKNFTQISEKLSPSELVAEIHTCFKAFDNIIDKHTIEKIKTIGDSYMCAGGLPVPNKTNATDVIRAAIEIQQFMQEHLQSRKNEGKEPFEIRIGIHTGAVVAGIVGVKKFAYDIWGDTVNIASRMESSGEAGKVNISGSTYELVKNKFNCTHRGKILAKNKGAVDMYFVELD